MFNFLTKLMSKNTKELEDKGLLASEMDLEQLRDLAVSIKLFSVEEVAKMKKAGLLKAIHAWEEKAIAKNKKKGMRVLGGQKPTVAQTQEEDLYQGKKVKSRTIRVINGKKYEDIKVSTGEVFTNPVKE